MRGTSRVEPTPSQIVAAGLPEDSLGLDLPDTAPERHTPSPDYPLERPPAFIAVPDQDMILGWQRQWQHTAGLPALPADPASPSRHPLVARVYQAGHYAREHPWAAACAAALLVGAITIPACVVLWRRAHQDQGL